MLRALSRVPQRCGGWRATELFGSPLRSPGLELCRRSLCDAPSESRKRECTVDDVVQWLHAERAEDVRALDVRELLGGAIGDALIFASGRSKAHMFRLAQAVRQEFKDRNVIRYGHPPMIEGKHSDDWLLIDGGEVVVSVFVPSAREALSLEDHWVEQGATELELAASPYEALPLAHAAEGAAAAAAEALPPQPPAHWGEVAATTPDGIYVETGDDYFDEEGYLSDERTDYADEYAYDDGSGYADGYSYADEYSDANGDSYADGDSYAEDYAEYVDNDKMAGHEDSEEYEEEYVAYEEGYYMDDEEEAYGEEYEYVMDDEYEYDDEYHGEDLKQGGGNEKGDDGPRGHARGGLQPTGT